MDSSDDEYELEYEPESFLVAGKIRLDVLSVVPPPLEFMSELHSQNQEISGRQVWCGSLVMSNVLCSLHDKDPTLFDNQRILELGSGTGLLGMVASNLGNPSCVVLTDGDDEAVTLLQKNLGSESNSINAEVTQAAALRWGGMAEQSEFCEWCQSKWPDCFGEGVLFDYIVAGDVMYKAELPPLFFETCHDLLASDGTLWLCHIPRASVNHELVVTQASNSGFQCEEFDYSNIEVADAPLIDKERAKVYRLKKL